MENHTDHLHRLAEREERHVRPIIPEKQERRLRRQARHLRPDDLVDFGLVVEVRHAQPAAGGLSRGRERGPDVMFQHGGLGRLTGEGEGETLRLFDLPGFRRAFACEEVFPEVPSRRRWRGRPGLVSTSTPRYDLGREETTSNAFTRLLSSSKLACTTSAPSSASFFTASVDGLRVIARTLQPSASIFRATEPPCTPVAPVAAIVFAIVGAVTDPDALYVKLERWEGGTRKQAHRLVR